ncbi:RNA-directed DNA polymerase, eukaryota, reverse transcriptase zinc-binding domain protein [Tanacetum coccineum]
MGSCQWHSKEDQTLRISKSVFVTNFPETCSSRDLWKVCNDYGSVVDVFIPVKKSKAGKRFAFVRFIKVKDLDRLVVNLCTIWIGRFHIHANVARFHRPLKPNTSIPRTSDFGTSKTSFASVLKEGYHKEIVNSNPALVLDDTCIKDHDFSLSLMGKVRNVTAIPNLYSILFNEGFHNTKITYLGGTWVLLVTDSVESKDKLLNHTGVGSWFSIIKEASNSFVCDERIIWVSIDGLPINAWTPNSLRKIASLWGEIVEWEISDSPSLLNKPLCLKTKNDVIINECCKIIIQGKVYWIRAKETHAWIPTFAVTNQDFSSSDDESDDNIGDDFVGDKDKIDSSDIDRVSESSFSHVNDLVHDTDNNNVAADVGSHSDDPFNLYGILNNQHKKANNSSTAEPEYPLDSLWLIIKTTTLLLVNRGMENGHIPRRCNASFIALIPKIHDAKIVKDFRPISLIGSIYKIITKILANRLCNVLPCLISEVQSAFVSNRNILDGLFILDELLQRAFGFGQKWCSWINGCFETATGSVLVNDDVVFIGEWNSSNIKTVAKVLNCFYLASGLKINFHKSKLMGVGVNSNEVESVANLVGCSTFSSPFKYLGVIVGDNMSRLKPWEDVISKVSNRLSNWKLKTLSIGGRLTLIKSVISSIPLYHMSIFKAPMGVLNKLESIRRNFFNGIDGMDKKNSWIGWDKILASKKNGGLGVSSLYATNRALLFKWIWRFFSQDSSWWSRFIQAMHGNHGALSSCVTSLRRSPWLDIIREMHALNSKGIDLMQFLKKKLGNGENTSFWDDKWHDDGPFKSLYPRLHALETCKSISVASKLSQPSLIHSFRRPPRGGVEEEQFSLLGSRTTGISLPNMCDRWFWSLESSGDFSVKSTRICIDDNILPKNDVPTRWVKIIPIKVNIHAWKVFLDKIPTRLNLSLRGMDIPSILCPLCNSAAESTSHIFFSCPLARQVWNKFLRWWEMDSISFDRYEDWLSWLNNTRFPKQLKTFLEGICYIMWWLIWRFRNQVLFGSKQPRRDLLFDDIVQLSYLWISNRYSSWWSRFIQAMHGNHGALSSCVTSLRRSPWLDIIREMHALNSKGIDLMQFLKKKLGNGENTSFWDDKWHDDGPFKSLYPRLHALETCKSISVASKLSQPSLIHSFRRPPRGGVEEEQFSLLGSRTTGISLPNMCDRWFWSLESSGDFSVKSTRICIDDNILPKNDVPTRWVKIIPIKVNIHAWKVFLDKLPTRLNLSLRGMDIPSILCPLCNSAAESTSHIFFSCPLARQVWNKFLRWWEMDSISFDRYEDWLSWLNNTRFPKQLKTFLEGICYIMWWLIWHFRNQVLFGSKQPRRGVSFSHAHC